MPALSNLSLQDRASTPVAHTFVPSGESNGVFTFRESTGVPIADNVVTVSTRKTGGGRYDTTLKAVLPIVQTETINGIDTPKTVRTGYFTLNFNFDSTSSLQERKDAVGLAWSALYDTMNAGLDSVLTDLEPFY